MNRAPFWTACVTAKAACGPVQVTGSLRVRGAAASAWATGSLSSREAIDTRVCMRGTKCMGGGCLSGQMGISTADTSNRVRSVYIRRHERTSVTMYYVYVYICIRTPTFMPCYGLMYACISVYIQLSVHRYLYEYKHTYPSSSLTTWHFWFFLL